jgi:hypothetical protein
VNSADLPRKQKFSRIDINTFANSAELSTSQGKIGRNVFSATFTRFLVPILLNYQYHNEKLAEMFFLPHSCLTL